MPISLFTQPARHISTRLRLLGRAFQLSGLLLATKVVVISTTVPLLDSFRLPRWMFPSTLTFAALQLVQFASLYIIGRGLIRKQRWSAWLGGITLGVPLLQQLLAPDKPILGIAGIIGTTLALGALVTVWPELDTEREADFRTTDNDDDEVTFPSRNRGFGDHLTLSAEPLPTNVTAMTSSQPLHAVRPNAER